MSAGEYSDDVRLNVVMNNQNPWWNRGGVQHASDVPKCTRTDFATIVDRLGDRQICTLIGARQMGKTAMMMQLAAKLVREVDDPKRVMYASLDEPSLTSGPEYMRHILEWYVGVVVREPLGDISERVYILLDEIQEVDGWQRILKRWVDLGYNAKFIVSGSSSIGILSGASESLIGRMRYQEVMPLSFPEYASLKGFGHAAQAGADMRSALGQALAEGNAETFYAAARSAHLDLGGYSDSLRAHLLQYMMYGGRPGVATKDNAGEKREMLRHHLQLAIYKDIVRIGGVKNPASIDRLISMLAWKSPQTINVSRLARDLDVGRETTKQYLHLLKAAYLVQDAELYSEDPGVRARADKRVYIGDPGTRTAALRALAGDILSDPADIRRVAETVVCDHTMRLARWYDRVSGRYIYYWRNSKGDEVDAVVRIGGKALPVESKHGRRTRESDFRGIRRFAEKFGTSVGLVVSDEGIGLDDDGKIVTIPMWLYLLMC